MIPILYSPEEKEYKSDGLGVLSKATFCHITEMANSNFELELHYPTGSKFDEYFTNEYQILAKPNDLDDPHAFKIYKKTIDEFTNQVIVYGHSRTYKLGKRGVQSVVIRNENGYGAMKAIEKGMDEKSDIELYSDIDTISSTTFEHRNVLNCIAGEQGSLLQFWGGEIKRENHRLSLLKRRGRDNVMSVSYRKNLTGLKVTFKWDGILTKIIPYAELQNNDGKTDVIYGSPVYSAMVDKYPDVYFDFVQFTEDQGVTDLASLNKVASGYFTKLNPGVDMPAISIEANIEDLASTENGKKFQNLRKLGLFDTFQLEHELWGLDFETKVNAIVYDVLLEKVHSIKAGAAQKTFYQSQNDQLQTILKSQAEKKYMSVFVDYVTKVISGNDGGNVVWWPKERPSDLFFIDSDTLETAKKVLRINKSGIGFSSKGWKGPFDTAWTLDGVFVADFIKAGVLSGILIQGNVIKTMDDKNFQVVLDKGEISFEKSVKATGLDDAHGEKIGSIFASYSDGKPNGVAFQQVPGQILSLNSQGKNSTSSKAVVQIPAESHMDERLLNLFGKVNLEGELYINGEKVYPGQHSTGGGGGWNGKYPPEVTTLVQKRAWEIWTTALGFGYTKQAAAALLGNMMQETNKDLNPTASENANTPGFGYGLVQWTDHTGRLSGRDYMISLMKRAGITDDPDTIQAQMKLIEWHSKNGQWGVTGDYPYTYDQFKKLTNIAVATYTFLRNFERAGVEAAGYRVEQANYWYNFLKDLKQPGGEYALPVKAGTPVTSWFGPRWGTNHNGIDFGGQTGDPIFAAQDGVVHMSLPTSASGGFGEYIVIKHNDGYMTGYAHNSARLVAVGDKVSKGQQIARMGSTGDSTGPHLHFSVQTGDWSGYVDPAPFLGLTPP